MLAVDLPGHGRSGGAPLASIEDLADWIVASLDAAQVGGAALVGHSMGSLAALECAARHPQRISRIALLGTAFPMRVSPSARAPKIASRWESDLSPGSVKRPRKRGAGERRTVRSLARPSRKCLTGCGLIARGAHVTVFSGPPTT